jgi:hypothetical protein
MHERSIRRHAIVRVCSLKFLSLSDLVNCIYPSHHPQGTMSFFFPARNGNHLSVKF